MEGLKIGLYVLMSAKLLTPNYYNFRKDGGIIVLLYYNRTINLMSNNILHIFAETEILGRSFCIYGLDEPLFLAKDVAEWIEHSNISKMLSSIDEYEKVKIRPNQKLGLLTPNNKYNFLTEDGLYEVLMQSRKPIAKQFKKEVKQLLKDYRKFGVVVSSKATQEDIAWASLYSKNRIVNTFRDCKDMFDELDRFIELGKNERKLKRINNQDRIDSCNILIDALRVDKQSYIEKGRFGRAMEIQEIIEKLQNHKYDLKTKLEQGKKAKLRKELHKAREKYTPNYDKMITFPLHAISVNNLYEPCVDKHDRVVRDSHGNIKKHKTKNYKMFEADFDTLAPELLPKDIGYFGIDENTTDIELFYGLVYKDTFDLGNLEKAITDLVLGKFYGIDDVKVCKITMLKFDNVKDFEDGEINIFLRPYNNDIINW